MQITDITGGIYIHSGASITGLFSLMEKLDDLEKQEFKTQVFAEYDERFQYFAGFAVFLILLEMLIRNKRNTWLSRFRIFD
jgi:Ca-activated chloride channel family protein